MSMDSYREEFDSAQIQKDILESYGGLRKKFEKVRVVGESTDRDLSISEEFAFVGQKTWEEMRLQGLNLKGVFASNIHETSWNFVASSKSRPLFGTNIAGAHI